MQLHLIGIAKWATVEMAGAQLWKKQFVFGSGRPAKLKEGNFRGEPDRDNSPAARSSNFIMLRFKFSTKKFTQAARQVSTKKRITKSYFWAFYLSACLSFSSLCPVCMCGCGGDNGGGVSLPRPLFLVPPALKLFLSLNIFTNFNTYGVIFERVIRKAINYEKKSFILCTMASRFATWLALYQNQPTKTNIAGVGKVSPPLAEIVWWCQLLIDTH